MKMTQCDKCKKIEVGDGMKIQLKMGREELFVGVVGREITRDYCQECAKELEKFIKGGIDNE